MMCDSIPHLNSVEFFLYYFSQYSLCIVNIYALGSTCSWWQLPTRVFCCISQNGGVVVSIKYQLDKIYNLLGDGHAYVGIVLIMLIDEGRPILIMSGGQRQLVGGGSLPLLCQFRDWTQVFRLDKKSFYPLSLFTSPCYLFFKCVL